MNNVMALEFARIGFAHHIHDDERVDGAAFGERARHVLGFRGGHSELVHEQRTGGFVAAWQAAPVTVSPYSNANQSQVWQRRGSKGPVPHSPADGEKTGILCAAFAKHIRS